jgi:hypothetical protein
MSGCPILSRCSFVRLAAPGLPISGRILTGRKSTTAKGPESLTCRPSRSPPSGAANPNERKANLARLLARRPEGIFVAPFEQGEIGPDLFRGRHGYETVLFQSAEAFEKHSDFEDALCVIFDINLNGGRSGI